MIPATIASTAAQWGKPRASGDDPEPRPIIANGAGVNPARAGMIPAPKRTGVLPTSKPRASGDDPLTSDDSVTKIK